MKNKIIHIGVLEHKFTFPYKKFIEKSFDKILKLLHNKPNLLNKSYWIMQEGNFYFPKKQNKLKKNIIKTITYLVTGTLGDYELVQKKNSILN